MGEILMPAVSAAGAAAFILAFSLSLDFWGRLVLRAVKAGDAAEPESMLGCAAGAAAAFVACRWLSFFTRSFETPLTVFVVLGVIGALWRLASELRASKADPARPSALESLRAAVAAREWAVVVSLLAFVLAFWFCSLWPSGEMEPWLTQSADYYSWTFFAGYWMGYGDAETYGIMNLHRWIFDAFGTNILYAMYSSARGVPAYIASGGFEILVLSWTGCAIYVLVRRLAGFPRWLAWLASLGVVGGWFCRFLLFGGLFGQLVAVFGYLLLMRPALSSSGMPPSRRGGFARVFVPLLFVFLSYQAGYVMFAAIFCAARFLRLSFGGDHGEKPQAPAGGAGGSPVPGPVVRFLRNVRASAGPVLASTALASAVCPQAAAQVALRTVTAAAQQTGYGLGLLDPGLFVGFPLIAETGFGVRAQVSPVEWAVFLLGLAVLAACALRRGTSGFPDRDLSGMRALCVLFAGFMFAYLAGYRLMGDDYRVWKFVSSAALPVSFVPAVLLVSSVREAARGREGRTWAACALAAAALAVPQLAYRNPSGPRTSLMNASSLTPIIETVSAALHFDRGQELLIFDFSSMEHVFAAMIVSQYSGVGRVRFVSAPYFGEALDDYLVYAERGAPVYSDRAYPDLYRGSPVALPDEFTVFRYDPFMLRSGGAVSYYGLYRFTFMPGVRGVGVRILVPQRLRGRDLVVRISFSDGMDGLDPACARPVAREAGTPPGDAVGRVGGAFLLPVPGKSQTDGHIGLILNFPDYPVTDPTDGRAWASPVPRNCMFRFDSVELLPPEDGPGGAEGRGRASAVEDPSSAGHGSAGAQ